MGRRPCVVDDLSLLNMCPQTVARLPFGYRLWPFKSGDAEASVHNHRASLGCVVVTRSARCITRSVLELDGNRFTGSIPDSISSLTALT